MRVHHGGARLHRRAAARGRTTGGRTRWTAAEKTATRTVGQPRPAASYAVSAGNPHGATDAEAPRVRARLPRARRRAPREPRRRSRPGDRRVPVEENTDEDGGEEDAAGKRLEKVSTQMKRRKKAATRSLTEPGCARARPFVRRGDVGDEDVALYLPDAGSDDDDDDDDTAGDDDLLLVDPQSRCNQRPRQTNHRRRERLPRRVAVDDAPTRRHRPAPPPPRPVRRRRRRNEAAHAAVRRRRRVSGTGCEPVERRTRRTRSTRLLETFSKPSRKPRAAGR